MRLTCPNCGAQYEVPDEVIPTSGRDVQCSDCGTTWFQHHPDHLPEPEEEDVAADWVEDAEEDASEAQASKEAETNWNDAKLSKDLDPPEEAEKPAEDAVVPTQDAPKEPDVTEAPKEQPILSEVSDDTDAEDESESESAENTLAKEASALRAAVSRELDPSVAEVLREEAEFEANARASEGGLETQQELGIDGQDSGAKLRSQEARDRMARIKGDVEELMADNTSATEDAALDSELDDEASRRSLLPDIDEINSSLGPEKSAQEASLPATSLDQPVAVPARKSGFRTGFRLAIILAVLGLIVYVFAPQLAEAIPSLAEPLAQYTTMIDTWRAGLDDMISNFATSLPDE